MKKNIKKVQAGLTKLVASLTEEVANFNPDSYGTLDHIRLLAMLERAENDLNVFNECLTGNDPIAEFRNIMISTATELNQKAQAYTGEDTQTLMTFAGRMDAQFHTLGILRTS